jgi:hypothetical protein
VCFRDYSHNRSTAVDGCCKWLASVHSVMDGHGAVLSAPTADTEGYVLVIRNKTLSITAGGYAGLSVDVLPQPQASVSHIYTVVSMHCAHCHVWAIHCVAKSARLCIALKLQRLNCFRKVRRVKKSSCNAHRSVLLACGHPTRLRLIPLSTTNAEQCYIVIFQVYNCIVAYYNAVVCNVFSECIRWNALLYHNEVVLYIALLQYKIIKCTCGSYC